MAKNTLKRLQRQTLSDKSHITQGGFRRPFGTREPDIVLQMPEIFFFDMRAYMSAVNAAKGIDFSSRVRLYDMYESALLDLHLSGVLAKRLRGVTRFPIEFQRNGEPDDAINAQLHSPWFKQLRRDLLLSEFWGFSLLQFYLDDNGNIRYDLIDRKHYDPVFHKLLKYQGDQDGIDINEFENILFVGTERGLGIFAELLPAVLYKRGDMSDWAKFCNIFGMPIREYTYDAGDEDARKKIIADARVQGSNAVYIHPNESEMKLIEAGNKTGSSDLYQNFAEYWDSKISIRVLGNTLTTDTKDTGTQALGTVHKEEEDDMNADDRDFLLDILNYGMKPIFENLGFNVEGGEFVYAHKDKTDPQAMLNIVQGMKNIGLPMDDDWLYETFGIEKPKDYDQQKSQAEAQKQAIRESLLNGDKEEKPNVHNMPIEHKKSPSNTVQTAFKGIANESHGTRANDRVQPVFGQVKQRLRGFFGLAPHTGADTDF